MSKKLIIFCDGTWSEPTEHGTNVLMMLQATESADAEGNPQLVHYIAGVGTRKGERFRGGTFGLGISDNIIDAYSFIVSNYEYGDEIFLFGFSRGAFTARSIAGLIHNLGVLYRYNLPLVAEAYKHYKNKTLDWKPKGKEADIWRQNNCHSWPTKIKFLGLWDTVGALGAPYGEILGYVVDKLFKCGFHNVELSESVESAYHALAADERRWVFRPTRVELTDYHNKRNRANRAERDFPLYAQKWFPGVHTNVGGGYDRHGLSDCALEWIADCAAKNGLNVKALDQVEFATDRNFERDLTQPIEKKPQFFYRVLTTLIIKLPGLIGLVPIYPRRDHPLAKYITWGGNYNRPRGQDEDVSVLEEKKEVDPDYHPPNVA
ncbi:MAG: DUF2235 domain-containing protein [Pseudomonadota bacterium]|nr:DUF2235 domain-containing protein [Pseudomonadota bacterium]